MKGYLIVLILLVAPTAYTQTSRHGQIAAGKAAPGFTAIGHAAVRHAAANPTPSLLAAPIRVKRLTIYAPRLNRSFGGFQGQRAKAELYFANTYNKPIVEVDVTVTVHDRLRDRNIDQLHLRLADGDSAVRPGKSGYFEMDMGDYYPPEGCTEYGELSGECMKITLTRVVFADGTEWTKEERP